LSLVIGGWRIVIPGKSPVGAYGDTLRTSAAHLIVDVGKIIDKLYAILVANLGA
jgi:hypothetical protein